MKRLVTHAQIKSLPFAPHCGRVEKTEREKETHTERRRESSNLPFAVEKSQCALFMFYMNSDGAGGR